MFADNTVLHKFDESLESGLQLETSLQLVWCMIEKVHDRNAKVGMKIHIHEYIIKFEKG